ncbi:MAG: hypothetical protein U5L01_15475 [Rheinheimera sp.]|nr:hypothetical protein [Rheinheimera sp.]
MTNIEPNQPENIDDNTNAERHQKRQQRLKAKVDERIAAATADKGLVLVITGNGKWAATTGGFGIVTRKR